jgi:hypothetical protein
VHPPVVVAAKARWRTCAPASRRRTMSSRRWIESRIHARRTKARFRQVVADEACDGQASHTATAGERGIGKVLRGDVCRLDPRERRVVDLANGRLHLVEVGVAERRRYTGDQETQRAIRNERKAVGGEARSVPQLRNARSTKFQPWRDRVPVGMPRLRREANKRIAHRRVSRLGVNITPEPRIRPERNCRLVGAAC